MRQASFCSTLLLCVLSTAALGQDAEISLVPVGPTTIGPGQDIQVEVFVNGIPGPQLLGAYQVQLTVVSLAGAVGSLGLVDPVTPDPNNASIFIDSTRTDWVFFGLLSSFPAANPDNLRIAATSLSVTDVTSPGYLGTYVFTSSAGTSGDFQLRAVLVHPDFPDLIPTFLIDQSRLPIPFTLAPDPGLTVSVVTSSPNDACLNSVPVTDGGFPFTTVTATSGTPLLPASCDEGNGLSFGPDVWFDYVATCNGVMTISTCGDADFDTRIAVYGDGGSACLCPTGNTFLEACNDDRLACAGGTSEVVLPAVLDTCHTIRVGGLGTEFGTANLSITCAPDLCGDAQPISVGASVEGSTANTVVNDAIGPDCGSGLPTAPGVWYSVVGTGELMTASLCAGADFDSRLTVYEGRCGALACVADADNTCGIQESAKWCSTPGTEYLILVHGAGAARGSFVLDVSDEGCGDGNACTDDLCTAGTCVNQDNFDAGTFCCTPSNGSLTTIDDDNPCTNDACNVLTGSVGHTPLANGPNAACEDGFACTFDRCISGSCVHTDIESLSCFIDADCPDGNRCVSSFCECIGVRLDLEVQPGASDVAGCFDVGELVELRVLLGPADQQFLSDEDIVAVQFFLSYDARVLDLIGVQPGVAVGDGSPFTVELRESVDASAGTIDYLVGVTLGGSGTRSPAALAVVTFQPVAECTAEISFRPSGPNGEPNIVAITGGDQLEPKVADPLVLDLDDNPPLLSSCPADIVTVPDPGVLTANVTWTVPTASDTCDGATLSTACTPASGTQFAPGTAVVTCRVVDSCGLVDECSFDVTVEPPFLTTDVELSASAAAGPFNRCVTFEVWDCSAAGGPQSVTVEQTLTFTNGISSGAVIPLPGGQWDCVTAQDELHTLRSTAPDFFTSDGVDYTASFVGNQAAGGHWLVGGNVNGDGFVDILDFAVFFPLYLSQAPKNMPCGMPAPDANINGDKVVDLLDLVFVSGNSLQVSEPGCCGVGSTASHEQPIMSISLAELRARGLRHLGIADINRDGYVDTNDVIALFSGELPPTDLPDAGPVGKQRMRANVHRGSGN